MKINIDIFTDKVWNKADTLTKKEMNDLIVACFQYLSRGGNDNFEKIKQVFLNVSFVNSKQIQKYNKQYKGKDSATNVLSFQNNNLTTKKQQLNNTICFLGEMVLCYEKIKQEAEEYNKPFKSRLYHLFVHSLLHLLGYDHITDSERIEMEQMEQDILQSFNITDLYYIA